MGLQNLYLLTLDHRVLFNQGISLLFLDLFLGLAELDIAHTVLQGLLYVFD
jgi:hypothetical protein